jgi:nucleoside-diphosphate-sugar epimerase
MKVLVTGGFGNIGKYVVEELINRKLSVRILDLKTKKNLKLSKRLKGIEIYWGDITNRSDVINALKDINVVVHLAFIIPKISSTNFDINKQPKLAEKINIYGTKNLIECMKEVKSTDKIIFTSSVHVYGITQHLPLQEKWMMN